MEQQMQLLIINPTKRTKKKSAKVEVSRSSSITENMDFEGHSFLKVS